MKPIHAPDDPEALRDHLRVAWLGEFLRHHEVAVAGGLLPVVDQAEVLEMLASVRVLHAKLELLFPDPVLGIWPAPVERPPDTPLILHGSTVVAVDADPPIPF